jgi:hypothetical protein
VVVVLLLPLLLLLLHLLLHLLHLLQHLLEAVRVSNPARSLPAGGRPATSTSSGEECRPCKTHTRARQ